MGHALKTYGRGDPQQDSVFVFQFCWVGFDGWARLICIFAEATPSHWLVTVYFKGRMFFLLTF